MVWRLPTIGTVARHSREDSGELAARRACAAFENFVAICSDDKDVAEPVECASQSPHDANAVDVPATTFKASSCIPTKNKVRIVTYNEPKIRQRTGEGSQQAPVFERTYSPFSD